MPHTKNQHYVSQFYLKNFSANARALCVFDKASKKQFGASITDISAERFFYDVPPGSVASGNPQSVENALSAMEDKYCTAIRELLDEVEQIGRFTPGPTDRNQIIAHFLIIQDIRTREFRHSFSSIVNELSAEIEARHEFVRTCMAEKGETVISENPIKRIPHTMSALAHARYMFNPRFIDSVIGIFLNHIWLIGDNQTGQQLYTSDSPMTIHSELANPAHGGVGYGSRGAEIAMPLSSRFILMLFERSWFMPRLPHKDGDVPPLVPDVVKHFNSRQVFNSFRQIYCQEHQFDLANELVERYPEVCEPGQSRFSIGEKTNSGSSFS